MRSAAAVNYDGAVQLQLNSQFYFLLFSMCESITLVYKLGFYINYRCAQNETTGLRLHDVMRQVGDVSRNVASSQEVGYFVTERVTVVIKQMISVSTVHRI